MGFPHTGISYRSCPLPPLHICFCLLETIHGFTGVEHSFAKAAVTKYPKLGGLTESSCLIVPEDRICDQGRGQQGQFLRRSVQEALSQTCLLALVLCWPSFGVPWRRNPSVCIHLHMVSSLCVRVSVSSVSFLTRTRIILELGPLYSSETTCSLISSAVTQILI